MIVQRHRIQKGLSQYCIWDSPFCFLYKIAVSNVIGERTNDNGKDQKDIKDLRDVRGSRGMDVARWLPQLEF